jgi:hypothetical protein
MMKWSTVNRPFLGIYSRIWYVKLLNSTFEESEGKADASKIENN